MRPRYIDRIVPSGDGSTRGQMSFAGWVFAAGLCGWLGVSHLSFLVYYVRSERNQAIAARQLDDGTKLMNQASDEIARLKGLR